MAAKKTEEVTSILAGITGIPALDLTPGTPAVVTRTIRDAEEDQQRDEHEHEHEDEDARPVVSDTPTIDLTPDAKFDASHVTAEQQAEFERRRLVYITTTERVQKPSLGRVVIVRVGKNHDGSPIDYMAHICFVHAHGDVVNLVAVNYEGHHMTFERVRPGDGLRNWRWPDRV